MWIEMNTCTSKQALREYLLIWGLVDDLVLQPTVPDQHKWKLSISGTYSSRSAYNAFFFGSIRFAPWKHIWRSWAPLRCKFFFGWPLTTGVGQLIALPSVGFLTRQHARLVIRLRKIFNTPSSHACSPDRFGPWFFKSWTFCLLLLKDPIFASLVGGVAPSKAFQEDRAKASIVWSS